MAGPEYKPSIMLQKAILSTTGVAHQLRNAVENGRREMERSRILMKETKKVIEQSKLVIISSQRRLT